MDEKRIPLSIEKEIEMAENRLKKLDDEVNNLLSYLRFLKERKWQFTEEEKCPNLVRLPAVQLHTTNSRQAAENDPRTDRQYRITILFINLLFVTMMLFLVIGGIEGAKTAWLLLGPMLSVMIYTMFKGR